jgi:hypothetical protein
MHMLQLWVCAPPDHDAFLSRLPARKGFGTLRADI